MKNYSTTEVATILGKSRQFIWLQIISNNLKAEKVGNYYSIKESDLNDFIENFNNGSIGYKKDGTDNE